MKRPLPRQRASRQRSPGADQPETFGPLLFGPVLFAFMAWLIRHPAVSRLDRLYFVSREGWMLEKLYNAMRERLALELPHGVYLHGSRRALLAAQMGAQASAGAGRIDATLLTSSSPWFEGSVEGLLLARIGFIPVRAGADDAARITLMRDAAIVHCVAELMGDEIGAHVRRAYAGFASYAEARGLLETKGDGRSRMGVVDVGYSATMQSAIQKTLGIGLAGFYMAVTEAARKVAGEGGYAFGAFAQGAAAAEFGGEFGLLLEAVLSAPHGQVIGYTVPDRHHPAQSGAAPRPSEPIFDAQGASQRRFPILERLHAGIQAFCLERLATHGLQPEADPFAALRRLGKDGIAVPSELRSALFVEDAFCGNGEIDVLARAAP